MPQPYQADENSKLAQPPIEPVEWIAKPDGRYYDYETEVGPEVAKRRLEGVTVKHQGTHSALREAGVLLQLAPEHIDLKRKEKQMSEEMNVHRFVEAMKNDMDAFLAYWKKGEHTEPSKFPHSLGEGDWYEQLLAWSPLPKGE